jgi:hypothetical protein
MSFLGGLKTIYAFALVWGAFCGTNLALLRVATGYEPNLVTVPIALAVGLIEVNWLVNWYERRRQAKGATSSPTTPADPQPADVKHELEA